MAVTLSRAQNSLVPCPIDETIKDEDILQTLNTTTRCNRSTVAGDTSLIRRDLIGIFKFARCLSAVDGRWSSWSSWSACGPDCSRIRRRSCNDPPASNGGRPCQGKDVIVESCSADRCNGEPQLRSCLLFPPFPSFFFFRLSFYLTVTGAEQFITSEQASLVPMIVVRGRMLEIRFKLIMTRRKASSIL